MMIHNKPECYQILKKCVLIDTFGSALSVSGYIGLIYLYLKVLYKI